jgi:hypothetical protein
VFSVPQALFVEIDQIVDALLRGEFSSAGKPGGESFGSDIEVMHFGIEVASVQVLQDVPGFLKETSIPKVRFVGGTEGDKIHPFAILTEEEDAVLKGRVVWRMAMLHYDERSGGIGFRGELEQLDAIVIVGYLGHDQGLLAG